jgi:uncharacterized protein (TIGR03067 family)
MNLRQTMAFLGSLLACACLAGFGAGKMTNHQGDDAKKLAGTWQVIAVEADGRKGSEEELKGLKYVFDAEGGWKLQNNGDTIAEGTYKLASSKKPKAIDYKITWTASDDKDKISLGVYEIDGDTLRVCRGFPGKQERPGEFTAPAGSSNILGEYKRIKS